MKLNRRQAAKIAARHYIDSKVSLEVPHPDIAYGSYAKAILEAKEGGAEYAGLGQLFFIECGIRWHLFDELDLDERLEDIKKSMESAGLR